MSRMTGVIPQRVDNGSGAGMASGRVVHGACSGTMDIGLSNGRRMHLGPSAWQLSWMSVCTDPDWGMVLQLPIGSYIGSN